MNLKLRARNAALGGLLLSVILYLLLHITFSPFVYWPQVVGINVCTLLRGVDSASETDFALISIPTNALIYALAILGISSLAAQRKNLS